MPLEAWTRDVRVAWRNALRRPAFTTLVVFTLALGIGVNSAMFAVLDGVLLRPLPYRDPSRLVFVWQTLPQHGVFELEATPFDYQAWHAVKSFASIALVATDALGDGLWRRRYGADPGVLGRTIRVNGVGHTIVGIMPPGATLPGPLDSSSELWLPTRMSAAERDNEISHNYTVLARLADRATLAGATAEVDAFGRRLATDRPESHRNVGARLVTFEEQTVHVVRPALLVVAGGMGLLLLVACANAATLLIARAAGRQREIAVRAALGAGAGRLLSLALADAAVFMLLGSLVGLVLAAWALRMLLPLTAAEIPRATAVGIDLRILRFVAALVAILAVAFGLVVAAHRPRALVEALKASTRMTPGASIARTRNVLVVTQVAFAVVLLAAAGLMINSFIKLSHVKPGFDADRVLSFRISLSDNGYAAAPQRIAFVDALTGRLDATPGVLDAAATSVVPFGGTRGANGVEIEGRPATPGAAIIIDQRHVTPGYFRTMRMQVVRGRGLRPTDDERAERIVVINRTMARIYWPDDDPIEHRVRVTAGMNGGVWFRIVGVVDDVRHVSLSHEPVPEMYSSYAQAAAGTLTVVVRTAADEESMFPAARNAVRSLDRSLPLYDVRSMRQRIAASAAQTRGTMLLLMIAAALAASLAGIAIYGSIWFSVSQRTPEIGIRLALGASRGAVSMGIVGRALALTAIGGALGVLSALAAGRVLAGLLFETQATDLRTYAGVLFLLIALTVGASIGPAWRAMSIDPVAALRDE